jgi:hypothetical protein
MISIYKIPPLRKAMPQKVKRLGEVKKAFRDALNRYKVSCPVQVKDSKEALEYLRNLSDAS